MGEIDIKASDTRDAHAFMRALLDDVRALERMLNERRFEQGVRRIGAEQEMFLVDPACHPAPIAMKMLETLKDDHFTTELARFNLEANLPPYEFGGRCLSDMEANLHRLLLKARTAAKSLNADILLTGILPTIQLSDLTLDNMTPVARYAVLNETMVKLRGGAFQVRIKGPDELDLVHDNVMMESCNTSFQIHFQVGCDEFAKLYNLSQVVSAPILAAATNSPFLLERQLWQETRVALFQHSVDDRTRTERHRGRQARVRFGDRWVKNSVVEIFREDIARFRVLVGNKLDEDPLAQLDRGEIPQLTALRLHNGTVYRWNRPCYGVADGVAHLRIENRVLPAGPTVIDEMANAAFYFGLMASLIGEYGLPSKVFDFQEMKANFIAAARLGLQARLRWTGGRTISASDLILDELLPLARQGLNTRGIDSADTDRYLGVIEARVRSQQTGSSWAVSSFNRMPVDRTSNERMQALASATLHRQWTNAPVHTWSLAQLDEAKDWRRSFRIVGQFMTQDLVTVQPDDLVDLAANMMEWEDIRHIAVESASGQLVGVLTFTALLRLLGQGFSKHPRPVVVRDVMLKHPITVSPETPTLKAIELMKQHDIGCLPVLSTGRLVGIVTRDDLFDVAARLLVEQLKTVDDAQPSAPPTDSATGHSPPMTDGSDRL